MFIQFSYNNPAYSILKLTARSLWTVLFILNPNNKRYEKKVSFKPLVEGCGSIENLRRSVACWYARYKSSKHFISFAKSDKTSETWNFFQLLEFFNIAEPAKEENQLKKAS